MSEECLLTVLYGVFSRVPRLFKRSAQTTRILIATQRHWWFIDRCWLDAWILMLCREDTPVLGILYRNFRITDVFLHVLQFWLSWSCLSLMVLRVIVLKSVEDSTLISLNYYSSYLAPFSLVLRNNSQILSTISWDIISKQLSLHFSRPLPLVPERRGLGWHASRAPSCLTVNWARIAGTLLVLLAFCNLSTALILGTSLHYDSFCWHLWLKCHAFVVQ